MSNSDCFSFLLVSYLSRVLYTIVNMADLLNILSHGYFGLNEIVTTFLYTNTRASKRWNRINGNMRTSIFRRGRSIWWNTSRTKGDMQERPKEQQTNRQPRPRSFVGWWSKSRIWRRRYRIWMKNSSPSIGRENSMLQNDVGYAYLVRLLATLKC